MTTDKDFTRVEPLKAGAAPTGSTASDNEPLPLLVLAEAIARLAHRGQKEESTGDDYIRHVERVVALVDGDDAKAVAWLHDVVEDSTVTIRDLCRAGIADDILDAVEALTRTDLNYAEYIDSIRMLGPELARVVKIADLRDHLRPNCPERLRPRYERALAALSPATATSPTLDAVDPVDRRQVERSDARKSISVSSGETARERWQPIDTAPKDGKIVLLYSETDCRTGYWLKRLLSQGGQWSSVLRPTHWMPLPAPPSSFETPEQDEKP